MKFFLFIFLVLPTLAWSYEEVFIQAVSQENKTFVTRNGRDKGIIPGKKATFITDNVAVVAKAKTVTREYTLWELDNEHANVPFLRGQIVTYQDAQEYAWTLMPIEKEMKLKRIYLKDPQWSAVVMGGYSRGISESTSGVNANAISSSRNGFAMETHVDYDITPQLELGAGFRYENEVIVTSQANLVTQRYLGLANIKYLFPVLTNFYNTQLYGGLSFGLGKSQTSTSDFTQAGVVRLLPSYRMGIKLPVTDEYWFLAEGSLDSLTTTELLENNDKQTTNQTIGKFLVGIKKYF
ncbi:MAG: hypothetical protein ACOYL6_11450 [Bacteriovoracaceae bacterium]